jgi:hypothetical protein
MLPALLGLLASLAVVAGQLIGWSPFWPVPEVNVAEAAAVSDAGEVVRLIVDEGQDPNRRWPVRSGIVGQQPLMLTPLEAAIVIRREPLVPVLLRHGVVVPDSGPARTDLICRAVAFEADRIAEMLLEMGDRSDPRATCPPPAN